ncbi:hypothetical protein [Aquimarina aggregata]|uniref:hypothetical protein n=1 Tax=Aquimarina aggregata TaxID=1642818 RepID=UPI002491830C|nr:hypothetical protein [Aquimarina aggregata]
MQFKLILLIAIMCLHFSTEVRGQEFKELIDGVVTVNSRTNVLGTTRKVVAIDLPRGARGFYWSVHVTKNGDGHIASRKILLDILTYKKKRGRYVARASNTLLGSSDSYFEDINIYLLETSSASSFKKRGNDDFAYYYGWKDVGDGARFIKASGGQTLYLGLHNTNISIGLKVYLQVVAVY